MRCIKNIVSRQESYHHPLMEKVLLCWLGDADFRGAEVPLPRRPRPVTTGHLGPIASAVEAGPYDRVVILNNRTPELAKQYVGWLGERTSSQLEVRELPLEDVTDHRQVFEAVVPICDEETKAGSQLTFHLSPGTPAMASVWLLLGKTRFPAELIRSSPERGVEPANVPFDISAELLPDLLREAGEELERASQERAPEAVAFKDIVRRSKEMNDAIRMAQRVALWPVTVLIEGESGTGKELFSRAIHDASVRRDKPFVAINCGAIPKDLVEAELFGHERGAFTGAATARPGCFEQAHEGTLFLDEIGELPLDAQVKLLRALDNREVRRIGGKTTKKVDVRVIAATNRSLLNEVAEGHFREDLFYRLAVTRLRLPPLRERRGDLTLLLDFALDRVNEDGTKGSVPGFEPKSLSPGAKNVFMNHSWPGNVRELINTVRRAAIWSDGVTIDKDDALRALLDDRREYGTRILGRPLSESFDINEPIAEVVRHYIDRALAESGGVKKRAAALLGFSSYQTLTNWMRKYGIDS